MSIVVWFRQTAAEMLLCLVEENIPSHQSLDFVVVVIVVDLSVFKVKSYI